MQLLTKSVIMCWKSCRQCCYREMSAERFFLRALSTFSLLFSLRESIFWWYPFRIVLLILLSVVSLTPIFDVFFWFPLNSGAVQITVAMSILSVFIGWLFNCCSVMLLIPRVHSVYIVIFDQLNNNFINGIISRYFISLRQYI